MSYYVRFLNFIHLYLIFYGLIVQDSLKYIHLLIDNQYRNTYTESVFVQEL